MGSPNDRTREQPSSRCSPHFSRSWSPSRADPYRTTVAEHEITQGAFNHLESAFESYRAADPQRDAYVVTASTAVFDPLVVSTSVAWPVVLKALLEHFGTTDKSRREAVDPGRLGFARVMDVLRKTNGIAQDPMRSEAAEILLSRLHRAVMCVTAPPRYVVCGL